jgi:hypothetical protein
LQLGPSEQVVERLIGDAPRLDTDAEHSKEIEDCALVATSELVADPRRCRPLRVLDGLDGFGQLRADRSALGFGEHDMSRATRPYERTPVLSSGTVSLIER